MLEYKLINQRKDEAYETNRLDNVNLKSAWDGIGNCGRFGKSALAISLIERPPWNLLRVS